jgi:cellulose 1,4-beta-cellobiosidase
MTQVHALGHPSSPMPQTKWAQPAQAAQARAGQPALPATVGTPAPVGTAALPAPNTPGAPTLAQGTGSNLTVSWVTPAVDGTHGGATGFAVRSSPFGAGTWAVVSGASSPYTLSGLTAGTAFDVQVQSSNAAGSSGWSATSTLTTASAGPYAPNAPTISAVAPPPDGTTGKLTISWAAPAIDATHGAATGYNLRSSPSGAGTWTTANGVASPYTLTGLSGASAIDVEVQGTNGAASPGAWSSIVSGSTWGATIAPGGWTAAVTQVHNLSVAPNGGVQATVVAAPTAVTGVVFAWSASNSIVPASGVIAAGADGQSNGWGQWFTAPATAGTFYLWTIAQGAGAQGAGAQGAGSVTIGALVTSPITVS